jgi:hypothetical protein
MSRSILGRMAVAAAATALVLAALAPVGASAAPGGGTRAAADASPSPTASLIPAGCPDVTDGRVSLETIIATGPAKMIECLRAADVSSVAFEAYFPSFVCDGCGGTRNSSIEPRWLSGGPVDVDADSGAITSSVGISTLGMRVETGPEPDLGGDAAAQAWTAANVLDLRLPPGIGSCATDGTERESCTVGRYADQYLRFTAHYQDPAASTCEGRNYNYPGPDDGTPLPAAAVKTYCEQQLVVDSFVTTEPHVCPSAPYTIGGLSHVTDDRLLACLGSRTITLTVYVPAPWEGGVGTVWTGTPAWLVQNQNMGMWLTNGTAEGATGRVVRIPPKLGACVTGEAYTAGCPFTRFAGKWVKVVGHFADPLSATCKATWSNPAPKPSYFTPDYVHQYCREQFVISAKPVAAKQPKNP